MLDLQLKDNVKRRTLDKKQRNRFVKTSGSQPVEAHRGLHAFMSEQLRKPRKDDATGQSTLDPTRSGSWSRKSGRRPERSAPTRWPIRASPSASVKTCLKRAESSPAKQEALTRHRGLPIALRVDGGGRLPSLRDRVRCARPRMAPKSWRPSANAPGSTSRSSADGRKRTHLLQFLHCRLEPESGLLVCRCRWRIDGIDPHPAGGTHRGQEFPHRFGPVEGQGEPQGAQRHEGAGAGS